MNFIPLTKGKSAIVDDADFAWLMQWTWKCSTNGYATRSESGGKTIWMHREIMKAGKDQLVDHRSMNTLDNRRNNLRLSSRPQNGWNRRKQRNNTSGHKGVFWRRNRKRWIAVIGVNGKTHHLGTFKTKEDAASSYAAAAIRFHGEFARTD